MAPRKSTRRFEGGVVLDEEVLRDIHDNIALLPQSVQLMINQVLEEASSYDGNQDAFIRYLQGKIMLAAEEYEKISAQCGFGRMRQFSGTCWFNAAINALFLSDVKDLFVKCWHTEWKFLISKGNARFLSFRKKTIDQYFEDVYNNTTDGELATAIQMCKPHKDIKFYVMFLTYFMFVRRKPFNPELENDQRCSCKIAKTMTYSDYTIQGILRTLFVEHDVFSYYTIERDKGSLVYNHQYYSLSDENPQPIINVVFHIGKERIKPTFGNGLKQTYESSGITFDLQAATISFQLTEKEGVMKSEGHLIAAFICSGNYYIYNSISKDISECDWTNLENVNALMKASYKKHFITHVVYMELLYLRRDWSALFSPRTSAQTRPNP